MPLRNSPVEHILAASGAQWREVGNARIATRMGTSDQEKVAVRSLALCDLSVVSNRLGVKGPAADEWLTGQGVMVPDDIYGVNSFDGGIIIRLGVEEFFVEGAVLSQSPLALMQKLSSSPTGVYLVERQDAEFVLCGERAIDVLAQTCALDFGKIPEDRFLLTQLALVSCGIMTGSFTGVPAVRLWVDSSHAIYLWETLSQIVAELGGSVVGAACLFPELSTESDS